MPRMTVELRSDLKCVSGSVAVADLSRYSELKITESIDGQNGCTIKVPRALGELAGLRKVLHVTDTIGFVREFRVRAVNYDPIGSMATIDAGPIHADLATAGLVRDLVYGFTVSAVTLTPAQWITNFVLTNLTADALPWLSSGTIQPVTPITMSFTNFTRLQVLRAIEEQLGCEFVLRRNGDTGYVIDLLTAVGSTATPLRAVYGRNLVAADVLIEDASLATVVQPTGDTPSGGTGPATIEYNAWRVVSTSGAGPYWVVLADPAGGTAPVAFDNQLNNLFVFANDGSSQQITGSRVSDSAIQVASIAALATGTHVMIAQTVTEGLLEVASPASVTQYGRLVRALAQSGIRGERNYSANGGFEFSQGNWTLANVSGGNQSLYGFMVGRTENTTVTGNTNGTHSGTIVSVALKNLPANGFVRRYDRIEVSPNDYTVSADALVNGSGEASITFSPGAVATISAAQAITRGTLAGSGRNIKNSVSVSATTAVVAGNVATPQFISGDKLRVPRLFSVTRNVTADTSEILGNSKLINLNAAFPTYAIEGKVLTMEIEIKNVSDSSVVGTYAQALVTESPGDAYCIIDTSPWAAGGKYIAAKTGLAVSYVETEERTITGTINQFAIAGTVSLTLSSAFTGSEFTAGAGVIGWYRTAGSLVAGPASSLHASSAYGVKSTSISGTSISLTGDKASVTTGVVNVIKSTDTFGFGGTVMWASAQAQANGSGTATVSVFSVSVGTLSDNSPINIARPIAFFDEDGGGSELYRIDTAYNVAPSTGTIMAESPRGYITVPSGGSRYVTASVGMTIWNRGATTRTVGGTVALYNATTNAIVGYATTTPSTFTILAGAYIHVTLRFSATITTSGLYAVRAVSGESTGGAYQATAHYIRWGMLHVGPDANVPYVAGSHANKLWKLANLELAVASQTPRVLRVKLVDLLRLGVPVGAEQITLGAQVVLEDTGFSGRLMAFTLDGVDEQNSEITLSTLPKRITNLV